MNELVIILKCQESYFSAISWREQKHFLMRIDDDDEDDISDLFSTIATH